jgi:hypothetical protein
MDGRAVSMAARTSSRLRRNPRPRTFQQSSRILINIKTVKTPRIGNHSENIMKGSRDKINGPIGAVTGAGKRAQIKGREQPTQGGKAEQTNSIQVPVRGMLEKGSKEHSNRLGSKGSPT